MAIFKVEGGHRLHGSITPQGAKNEALQILCATLLTPERVTVHNIPQILDVMQLIELLRRMGVEVEQLAEDTYSFCAREIDFDYLRTEDYRQRCTRLRGSVMLIGPMLARFGVGYIPKPGGDKIGRRRLDTHFLGFQKLGAKFNFDIADEFFMVEGPELKGTYMLLDEASVTGTANIVMAAVMAKGFTTIYNAACEPYLQQLCKMLNRMGARISGIASNLLTIEGVESLGGTEHTLLPDMIEVGSFIGMAAMNQSELTIRNVSFENLGIIPAQFARMGIRFEQHDANAIRSTPVDSPRNILLMTSEVDVVGIDEAQFFDESIVEVCRELADSGVRVIVAGLDMDYTGKPFGPMPALMATAEYVTKVHAICVRCGNLAHHSHRLTQDEKLVVLGETDSYEAICRHCFKELVRNKKEK